MRAFSVSDKGPVRRENQDHAEAVSLRAPRATVLLVCDGMGGANSGALASTLAAGAYLERLRSLLSGSKKNAVLAPLWMRDACTAANEAVFSRAAADSADAGMGTTLVSAVVVGHRAEVINVGDSRAYLIRDKALEQITHDHSVVAEMVERGELTPEQALHHPNRNLITRAVGVDQTVDSDLFSLRLRRGDRLLLCSDGLSNTLSEEELLQLSCAGRSAKKVCHALVNRALEKGARDNVSAAIAIF